MTQILDSTPIESKMPMDDQMAHEETEARDIERGTPSKDTVVTSKDPSEPSFELKSHISSTLKNSILGDAGIFPSYRNCMPIIFSNTWGKRGAIPFGTVEDAVHNTFIASPERWIVHEQLEIVANPCDDIVLLGNVWLPSGEREDVIELQKKSFDWTLNFAKNFHSLYPSRPIDEPFTDEDDSDGSDDEDKDDGSERTCSFDGLPIDSNICEIRPKGSACYLSPTLVTSSYLTRPSTLHNLFILLICLFSFVFAILKFLPLYDRTVYPSHSTHCRLCYYDGLRST